MASESTYDQDEDDLTQVAFAVKAYITQNGSAVDAMRGGWEKRWIMLSPAQAGSWAIAQMAGVHTAKHGAGTLGSISSTSTDGATQWCQ